MYVVGFSSFVFTPAPFEIMLPESYTILWRISKGIEVKAGTEGNALVLSFINSVPIQPDLTSLKLPKKVDLEKFTKFSGTHLQPMKHIVKYILPPTVIRENYIIRRTPEFVAFQYAVGRTANFDMAIPEPE